MASLAHAAEPVIKAGEEISDRFQHRIAALRREIAALATQADELTHDHRFEVARDTVKDIARGARYGGGLLAREIGQEARLAGRTLRDNPVPAVVAIGTFMLLAHLFNRD